MHYPSGYSELRTNHRLSENTLTRDSQKPGGNLIATEVKVNTLYKTLWICFVHYSVCVTLIYDTVSLFAGFFFQIKSLFFFFTDEEIINQIKGTNKALAEIKELLKQEVKSPLQIHCASSVA